MESVGSSLDDWACLARLGFAASEAGDRKRGRVLVERALRQRPQALYVIHSYAHVLHDRGEPEESLDLLGNWLTDTSRQKAAPCMGMSSGIWRWRMAVGIGRAAWQRYDGLVAPETTRCGPVLTLADCGGFLCVNICGQGLPARSRLQFLHCPGASVPCFRIRS